MLSRDGRSCWPGRGRPRARAQARNPLSLPLTGLSNLHLKEEKIKPDANGAVVKTNANAEKTEDDEKEDRAAQSLLNKLIRTAFVLAMLSQVEPANKYPQCLCLSPTYELALQTGKVIEQMGKFYPELKLAYAVRGNKCE
ncbi:ATP-dependent RNA helicase DDX19B-like [Mastomys coucha]|uniref:ATP-dependent RNA helicase DDX19B-like n=1 Tax=Mastomys coucha TaxID=35658 RepID=UPI001262366D|nr:ATP-dependent RNA helicase DDX19B-like [Mastomys coucha]